MYMKEVFKTIIYLEFYYFLYQKIFVYLQIFQTELDFFYKFQLL